MAGLVVGDRRPGVVYQPSNVIFALFPPLDPRATASRPPDGSKKLRGKAARKEAHAERARKEIEPWLIAPALPSSSPSP